MISISLANWLFVIIFFFVLVVGGVLQTASAGWGLLATELLLILTPVLLVFKVLEVPIRKSLSLVIPTRSLSVWSLLSGFGLGLFSQLLLNLVVARLGYTLPILPQIYPRNSSEGLVLVLGLIVIAPVCEEVLFRGAIMGAYRRTGVWRAIAASGLLFAAFHGSLQRFFILLPLAVLAGYVAWRVQSLFASMLLHAGYNITGALAIVFAGTGGIQGRVSALVWLVPWFGIALAAAGLAFLHKNTKPEVIEPASQPMKPIQPGFRSFSTLLPFILALPLFMIPSASEVISGKYPERLAESALTFQPDRWPADQEMKFELRNALDLPVGEAACSLKEINQRYRLECRSEREAFEAQVPGSYFKMDRSSKQWWAEWTDKGQLSAYESFETQGGDRQVSMRLDTNGVQPVLSINRTGESEQILTLRGATLLPDEWPWRLQALPIGYPYRANTDIAIPAWWSAELQRSFPTVQTTVVNVITSEPVYTSAGRVICWKVQAGNLAAYYSVDFPHNLIRYDDGVVSYLLISP